MINESRLMKGTLSLGPTASAVDFSCQITNARITSAYSDDGDSVTTLCGDTKPPPRKLDGHKLEGTLVQDFDLAETEGGTVDYLWNHNLEIVAYSFIPNEGALVTITGTLQIEIPAETYGGDVNKRVTSDFVWNLQEDPTRTYGADVPLATAAA
jgi:hypothetical protein